MLTVSRPLLCIASMLNAACIYPLYHHFTLMLRYALFPLHAKAPSSFMVALALTRLRYPDSYVHILNLLGRRPTRGRMSPL